MLNVVCVLKRPDKNSRLSYDSKWVQKLQRGVARNLSIPHNFVCLSDMDIPDVNVIPLQHDWMMYWSKIEMFRPGLFKGLTLYFDIDSMICGSLMEFIASDVSGMTMLTDYYPSFKNSGFMRWNADDERFTELYRLMEADAIGNMIKHRYRGPINYGDQEFIATNLSNMGVPVYEWQKLYPKEWFLEFSFEGRANQKVCNPSSDVKLCYSLGSPKFSDLPDLPLVQKNWV